jgi:nucleoside-diphosphate-sugar epimerase
MRSEDGRPSSEVQVRILVLGGTRFIGPHVVRRLVAEGHDVALFHRGRTEADLPAGVPHIHGSLRDAAEHVMDFRKQAPETVLFMVPIGEDDARIVMETFDGLARRLVAVTSQDVYRAYGRILGNEPGPPISTPLDEDAPLRERLYPYRGETARSDDDPAKWMDDYDKILVERVVMGHPRIAGTILRLPMVYGENDGGRIHGYLKRMDDGRQAILLDEAQARWRWSRGYVEDVASAVALALTDERAAGRIYNIAETDAPTEREWIQRIATAASWTGKIVELPQGRLPVEGDFTQDLVADTTRIRRELGYAETISREEAMLRTVRWQRAHPPKRIDPAQFDYAAEDAILKGND